MLFRSPFHPLQPIAGIYSLMDGENMDGRWRSVGDDDGEDLLHLLIPAGCQNGVSDPRKRFDDGGRVP